ncbi:MAG TPA: alanine-zipper protein [Thermodesulfovibrionales bacterium]|nr:alanine-zipper protein [Thermodesulfovibrionales bacterium]
MKRSLSLLAITGFSLFLFSGCASRDYVKQQVEPLLDRLSKVEAMTKECCEKAEGAAQRAEAAAKKATTAAEKSTKSFELQQKK